MQFARASVHDTHKVALVLSAAARQLALAGHRMWEQSEVSEAAVRDHVVEGKYYLAKDAAGPIGVFRFQLEDPDFWPEESLQNSAFIHRLAVHPRAGGGDVSKQLLVHAIRLAKAQGRTHLRLDCAADRPKLRSFYERAGFKFHSLKQVGPWLVARYEMAIASGQ